MGRGERAFVCNDCMDCEDGVWRVICKTWLVGSDVGVGGEWVSGG